MVQELNNSLDHVEDEAFVIVKAAPRVSSTYGETVCIAAIDHNGYWVRLYPVSFRQLEDAQKFGRWDRICYRWRKPPASTDKRIESRRVDQNSIEITGKLRERDRQAFLNRAAVTSLRAEFEAGRSLAILQCDIVDFWHERRTAEDMVKQAQTYQNLRNQHDLFVIKELIPRGGCPYVFKYRYHDADGEHEGTCQDWETEATFLRRRSEMSSETAALEWMRHKFGVEYPRDGMTLAMGTHRWRGSQWLINGVLRVHPTAQMSLL